ncbi:hypothetical protein PEX1_088100 [Penicillium expansum]|uniref:Secreted protein n=1 Tax=Penicillium expansum TaxID=27334 RepID=A0A0A2K0E7_PENEN|nr:hypothetical protein PEX2_087480 [Penicillium expansum]KGO35890.1 hypothetical protein PEXP_036780 [Penicillium expansum]KGO43482.1 hypothetical protein PEX1_088100 [Penicillium expansum]KGO60566.1 hypothetical protein PEX2_087480 [Penicillium expansum]
MRLGDLVLLLCAPCIALCCSVQSLHLIFPLHNTNFENCRSAIILYTYRHKPLSYYKLYQTNIVGS